MTTTTRTRTLRALVYARQSHGEKKSIDDQIAEITEDLQDLADETGTDLVIVRTHQDRTSASRYAKRPRNDHPKVLAAIAAGQVEMIGLWETSRASREMPGWTAFLDLCRVHGVLVRDAGEHETYDMDKARDRNHLWHEGIKNAEFSEDARKRTLRGVKGAARDGLPNGPVPYGYRRDYRYEWVPDPDNPGKEIKKRFPVQTEEPDAARIVREVFQRVADGEPILRLAEELASRDDVPPAGQWRQNGNHGWTPGAVRTLVKNITYIAKRRHTPRDAHNRPNVSATKVYDTEWWPPLVSDSQFYAANRVLDERAKRYWRPSRTQHLLSGIPRCARCAERGDDGVYSGSAQGRHGKVYTCRKCGAGITDGPALEDTVTKDVLSRLSESDVRSTLRVAGETTDAERAAAEVEVARLRANLDAWTADVKQAAKAGNAPSAEMVAEIEADFAADIATAAKKVEQSGVPPHIRRLLDADDVAAEFGDMELAAQRDVIADLVEITITAAGRGKPMPLDKRLTIRWKDGA